jgi:hypothetical protein
VIRWALFLLRERGLLQEHLACAPEQRPDVLLRDAQVESEMQAACCQFQGEISPVSFSIYGEKTDCLRGYPLDYQFPLVTRSDAA